MKELLEFILKNIVEKEDEIKIKDQNESDFVKLSFSVAGGDMARVIGKSGKVIKALRTLTKIYSLKNNKRIYLELVESENSQ